MFPVMPELVCQIFENPDNFIAEIGKGDASLRYFNHPTWVDLVWNRMEAKKGGLFVGLFVSAKGVAAGWWPLVLSRRNIGYRLQNIGQEISDYAMPHIQMEYIGDADAVFSAMLAAIWQIRGKYAYLQWQQFLLPAQARIPAHLNAGPSRLDGWTAGIARENYYIECGPFLRDADAWFSQRLSRNMRKNLRHEHNVLKRHGDPVLHAMEDLNSISSMRQAYMAWYRYGDQDSPERRQKLDIWWSFFEALAGGILDASRLDVGGVCVSLIFGFRRNDEYDLFSLAFSPEYAHLSPGKQHLVMVIQREIERGTKRFNFMVGDEPYKRQLSTDSYLTWDIKHTHLRSLSAVMPWIKTYLRMLRGKY